MTNRRQFFSRLFGGIATASVAPSILIPKLADKQIWRPRPQIIELRLTSTPIIVKPRKLKAKWTFEMEQDMQFYHSISQDDLGEVMRKQINQEIDAELVNRMIRC